MSDPRSLDITFGFSGSVSLKPVYLVLTIFLTFWTLQLALKSVYETPYPGLSDPFVLFGLTYLLYHYIRAYILFFRSSTDSALRHLPLAVDLTGLALWSVGIFVLIRREPAFPDLEKLTTFIVLLETALRLAPCLFITVALFCLPCILLVTRNFRSSQPHLAGVPSSLLGKLRTGLGESGASCPICLAEISGQPVTFLPCGHAHAFHCPCIAQWLQRSCLCPVCRANVVDLLAAADSHGDTQQPQPHQLFI